MMKKLMRYLIVSILIAGSYCYTPNKARAELLMESTETWMALRDAFTLDASGNLDLTLTGDLTIGNLKLSGNTISSLNMDGNILLSPNGTGKIGIGISTPNFRMHMHESSSLGVWLQFSNDTTGITGTDGFFFGLANDESGQIWSETTIEFYSGGGGKDMEIEAAGNVTIAGGYGSTGVTIQSDGDLLMNGKLTVDGFTMLGSAAPVIKMKKLTGTTEASEGDLTNIAHGFGDISKILSFHVLVTQSSGNRIPPVFTSVGEYEYDVFIDVTNVKVQLHTTNSGNILSKAITVLITYEE